MNNEEQQLVKLKKQYRKDAKWIKKDLLIDLYYNQKHGTTTIAKILGVSLKLVTNNFKRYNLQLRSKKEQMEIIIDNYWRKKIDIEELRYLVEYKGYNRTQLEQHFKCCKRPIEKVMQANNIKFARKFKLFCGKEQEEKILKELKYYLYEQKITKKQICKIYSISHNCLQSTLSYFGLLEYYESIEHHTRNHTEYRTWRKSVFEKYKNKCFLCGNKEHLVTHHIKRWKDYEELRFDVDNGMVVCFSCHQALHKNMIEF